MDSKIPSIAIYGIPDINNSDIATISHDHSIAVMHEGDVIYHGQLERIDRIKYSNKLPQKLLTLLRDKNLLNTPCDLIFVDNVLGRCFINETGNIRFEAPLSKTLSNDMEEGKLWWLNTQKKAYALNHELAHIGSCLPFFGAFINNSLLIHYDGGASLSNFSAWHFNDGELKLLKANWDLKPISSLFNANALMFGIVDARAMELNSVPGKLMGFASFGKNREDLKAWLIKNNFFENIWKSKASFFKQVKIDFNIEISHLSQKEPFIQDIVATTHTYFVEESMKQFRYFQELTNTENLYYSGGTALSIVLNTELINSGIFKNVHIPPCCNDSGLALGAASFMEWKKGHSIKKQGPYLNNWNIEDYNTTFTSETIKKTADLLCSKKIVGICNGIAEIGPRALGNRSIICLASSKKIAKKVSMDIKKREWYRPVAPIMLKKNASYFTNQSIHPLTKYMLLDYPILESKQKEIEGALHIDHTARIQSIENSEDNPFMHTLLEYLDEKHEVKALINTSFNASGEPIVHTKEDAIKSAKRMKLDAVILNGELVLLN